MAACLQSTTTAPSDRHGRARQSLSDQLAKLPRGALPPIEYGPADEVRRVQDKGHVSYKGKCIVVGKAFRGYPIAFRPTTEEGILDVYFCHHRITQIDMKNQ